MKYLAILLALTSFAFSQTKTVGPSGEGITSGTRSAFLDALGGTTAGKSLFQITGNGTSGQVATSNGSGGVSWATVTSLPSQTSNSGKFLTTNGTAASWANVTSTTISDSTTAGRALLTAEDAAAQRTSLGLGTAATLSDTKFASYSRLFRFRNLTGINGYTNPRIGLLGDSMIGTSRTATLAAIKNAYGISGWGMLDVAATSGASTDTTHTTYWLTGETTLLPLNGIATYSVDGSYDVEGDTLKVYYLQNPGAGFFKIQSQANGGTWTDESGYTAIDTNGTLSGKVITIQKSAYKTKFRVRCVGLGNNAGGAGAVNIIGAGVTARYINGAVVSYITNNSSSYNNIDNASVVSREITDPILSDLGFNLVMLSHLDGASFVNSYQATLQDNVTKGLQIPDPTATFSAAVGGVCTRAGHGWSTTQPVRVASTSALPSGISADTTYYLIKLDNNTFKLASTVAFAVAGTGISLGTTGSGTLSISIDKAPSWIIIGPPVGPDSTADAATEAQATAQETLAATRGDAFFDNRKWALPIATALANKFLLPGDPHYQADAYNQWVPSMFSELGLNSLNQIGGSRKNQIEFKRGAVIRDIAVSGNSYNPSLEIVGALRLSNAPNESGQAFILFPRADAVSTSESDFWNIGYRANGFGIISPDNSGFYLKNNSGVLEFYSTYTSANQAYASLGTSNNRWGRAYFTKLNTASGTTGNQNAGIGVTHGTVRFAAGSSTPIVVTATLADTTCNIICQVYGTDATLTSVRVTKASGTFTITPNAAATAECEVAWFILL